MFITNGVYGSLHRRARRAKGSRAIRMFIVEATRRLQAALS
jgi:hypothetical protein